MEKLPRLSYSGYLAIKKDRFVNVRQKKNGQSDVFCAFYRERDMSVSGIWARWYCRDSKREPQDQSRLELVALGLQRHANRKRDGVVADNFKVGRHGLVPGLASQTRHSDIFFSPARIVASGTGRASLD